MSETIIPYSIPIDQYGLSKYIMNIVAELKNSNIYNLRLFSVYGKYGDYRYRFIENACCRALKDMPIYIQSYTSRYDFVFVEDLIPAIEYIIDNKVSFNSYNICSGLAVQFKDVVKIIADILEKEIKITYGEGKTIIYGGNNNRLLNEMKHTMQFTPLEIGIRKTLLYMESIIDKIKKEDLEYCI